VPALGIALGVEVNGVDQVGDQAPVTAPVSHVRRPVLLVDDAGHADHRGTP
jgi:hypothetical protein